VDVVEAGRAEHCSEGKARSLLDSLELEDGDESGWVDVVEAGRAEFVSSVSSQTSRLVLHHLGRSRLARLFGWRSHFLGKYTLIVPVTVDLDLFLRTDEPPGAPSLRAFSSCETVQVYHQHIYIFQWTIECRLTRMQLQ